MRTACAACLMPFKMDEGQRQNPDYCSYCQQDGQFNFSGTRQEFQQFCYKAMVDKGMNKFQAKFFAWMIRFAPHWKRRSKN